MNCFNTRTLRLMSIGLAIALVPLGADITFAGKPDKPGGGGSGEASAAIFVRLGQNTVLTMNEDGSGKAILPGTFRFAGEPSHSTPNGHRWFLAEEEIATEFYPDAIADGNEGAERREIVAVRDDGNMATGVGIVALTLQADLEPLRAAVWPPLISARWGKNDSFVSFIGRRWDDDPTSETFGEVLEGGLYVAELAYDAGGNVAGLVAQPQEPLVAMPLVPVEAANRPQGVITMAPDNGPVVWSPSGGYLLYHCWDHFGGGTDVYRMTSKGGGKTNLTADVISTAPPMRALGWR
jgi:hypothetical protein